MAKILSMPWKMPLFCSFSENFQKIPLLTSKIFGKTQAPKVEIVVSEKHLTHVRRKLSDRSGSSSTLFTCSALKIQAESFSIPFLSNIAVSFIFAFFRLQTCDLCCYQTTSFLLCLSFSPARTRLRIIRSCFFATAFGRCAVFWGGCLIAIRTFV